MSEEEARSYLGRFLFSGDDVFKTVSVLSGGEKSRVALAKLILQEPNVLVLDEPTNHLDLSSQDALQSVLASFPGTLLFVSHDRYLIDALAEQLWVLDDGRLTRYPGGYSDFAEGLSRPLDRSGDETAPPDRQNREGRVSPEARVRELEDEVVALADRLSEIASTTPAPQLVELMDRYDDAQRQLREADKAWLRAIRESLPASSA